MVAGIPFFFASLGLLVGGAIVAAIAVWVARRREVGLPRASWVLAGAGLVALLLAAGGLGIRTHREGNLEVMVDLSPSTRTAEFRNRASLEARIKELTGEQAYRVVYFADGIGSAPSEGTPKLEDIACEKTTFRTVTAAEAVLLFSDARFEPPTMGPRAFVVVDPALEHVRDAAVKRLELRGNQVAAAVDNSDELREFTLSPMGFVTRVPRGKYWINRDAKVEPGATITAALKAGDAWPENDTLAMEAMPTNREKWWVGASSPAGWRRMNPEQLPIEAAAYLGASVIVIENIPADAIGEMGQRRLAQYVRDLGGAVVILGGGNAFAAGGYAGTAMEGISPLASEPPEPETHWMIVLDSSGSMAETVGAQSKWQLETAAVARLVIRLPSEDLLSVGSFSRDLTWWWQGKKAADVAKMNLPPAGNEPGGPTNLEAALKSAALGPVGIVEKQLLVLTDAQAKIEDPGTIVRLLKDGKIHLSVLAIGPGGPALEALREICRSSGGQMFQEADANKWAEAVQKLYRALAPKYLNRETIRVVADAGAPPLVGLETAAVWNRTWIKSKATMIAHAQEKGQAIPMIARWEVGNGTVLGVAMQTPTTVGAALGDWLARPPRDPRLAVTWSSEEKLAVEVKAIENQKYLNGLKLSLEFVHKNPTTAPSEARALEQIGPGRYRLAMATPREPGFAILKLGENVVDNLAVAGRYAPEFEQVGNDRRAMKELARRTGGRVIEPAEKGPIDFGMPGRAVSLISVLAAIGAALLAAAVAWWKAGLLRRRAMVIARDEPRS